MTEIPTATAGRRGLRALNLIATVALVAATVGWALFLRPHALGGSTTFVVVSGDSMEPGLHSGDLVLVRQKEKYSPGQVVAYRVPRGEPAAGSTVIHRILRGSGDTGFVVQGDNRALPDLWRPVTHDVLGAAFLTLPHVGVALVFLAAPLGLASMAGVMTFLLIMRGGRRSVTTDANASGL
jgi:signal peptidase